MRNSHLGSMLKVVLFNNISSKIEKSGAEKKGRYLGRQMNTISIFGILDSERNDEYIDFTIMYMFFF